jgi:putative membrane protein
MTDLELAIAHHILMFAVFGVLFAEFMMVRQGLCIAAVRRIASLDGIYGIASGLIVLVGFSRAIFAAKGWEYYSVNWCFWAKIATFAAIGLLSVRPTLLFIRWRRAGVVPADTEVAAARKYLHIELALFVLLPIFAAAMARGYGQL